MNIIQVKSSIDLRFMGAALRLARRHQGITGTNPSVACVIAAETASGPRIVGSGVTAPGGRPHAEPFALAQAGEKAKGATAYVTLEPCAHHGKTPPCAQTLIDAGIARVVTAIGDPDRRVDGKGHAMLRASGVRVVEVDGGEAASRVLQGYLKSRVDGRPFVTLKMALCEDGVIGTRAHGNLRITCDDAMSQTHLVRARSDAILVGSGTALADDPSLTCRLPGMEERSPLRIVLDTKSRLQPHHTVIATARKHPTMVVAPVSSNPEWLNMLWQNGVQHMSCEMEDGRIAMPELLDDIGARGIQTILVEAGAALAQTLLRDGLVDQLLMHVGCAPQTPPHGAQMVRAPFTPSTPPQGFELVETLHFGCDRSMRFVRS